METFEWPWQFNFPPFFTIQVNQETLKHQLTVWRQLVIEYMRANKLCILDVREASKSQLFHNTVISRRLSEDGIVVVMKDLARIGHAEPVDKSLTRWFVFWEPLEKISESVHKWAVSRGMINTVCTFFELTQGDDTTDQLFHGLDDAVLERALRKLEIEKKAELLEYDNSKGVKFF